MEGKLYLIERINRSEGCRYYAEHGEMGGVADAIAYDTSDHAQKFRTEEDALHFIQTGLPAWGRDIHRPASFTRVDFGWDNPELMVLLRHGAPVPDQLLEPTAGRLRIWRR